MIIDVHAYHHAKLVATAKDGMISALDSFKEANLLLQLKLA